MTEDQKTIQELREQILVLQQQLDWFKRQLFGKKGEQFQHPDLFGDPEAGKPAPSSEDESPEEGDAANAKKNRPGKKRNTRAAALPKDLPVRTEVIDPEEVLRDPAAWRLIDEDPREWLEKDPGYFYLIRKIYRTYVPLNDPVEGKALTAPAPPTIIENGFWGPGLLSEVLCNRFLYHLPYDRQQKLYSNRFGIHLPKQTMSDAALKAADQLGLLTTLMKRDMLACGYIRADETEARYLDSNEPGGSSTGRFWLYKALNGNVLFDWQLDRKHHHLFDWLGPDFQGILGSDAYEAYPKYCLAQRLKGKVAKRAACLAHIRRKYETALKQKPHLAAWYLKIFGQIYQIEAALKEMKADEQIKVRYRRRYSLPLLKLIHRANQHLRDRKAALPAGRLGQAISYTLNQWEEVLTYIDHGQVEIDNNGVERDVRPVAIGRKNYLFVGSPEAGDRSAVLYSLLISARHHGVDPEAYLREVIERLPGCGSNEAALRELLPENWAAAHKSDQNNLSDQQQAVA